MKVINISQAKINFYITKYGKQIAKLESYKQQKIRIDQSHRKL